MAPEMITKKLNKIITFLTDIGSELSRIDKEPTSEKQAWKIINKNCAVINALITELLQSNELKNKELINILKKAKERDLVLYWGEIEDKLRKSL